MFGWHIHPDLFEKLWADVAWAGTQHSKVCEPRKLHLGYFDSFSIDSPLPPSVA